jgi:hypothetical protein
MFGRVCMNKKKKQSLKKPSKIEKHYQFQLPPKKVDPS